MEKYLPVKRWIMTWVKVYVPQQVYWTDVHQEKYAIWDTTSVSQLTYKSSLHISLRQHFAEPCRRKKNLISQLICNTERQTTAFENIEIL